MAKKPQTHAPRYDVDLVRQAASRRWPEILSSVGGVAREFLNGQHHPCPKCGGNDRFRAFTDGSGGAICNQCFNTKNGDGFAVLQWLASRADFLWAVAAVAEYIGIPPEDPKKGGSHRGRGGSKRSSEKADPAEHLDFLPWDELSAAY